MSSPPWPCDDLPAAHYKYKLVLDLLHFMMAILIVVAVMFIHWHGSSTVIGHYGSCLRQNYSEEFNNRFNDQKYYKIPAGISEPNYDMPYLPLISIIMKNSSKEYAEWLHIANIDEIQGSGEENVSIDDILQPVSEEKLRLVLIEGEPGIGKSTLAIELVSRWVKQSDENLNRFEIVIFIQLRSETYHSIKSIEDLLVVDKKINTNDLMDEIENKKGADILWILDGLDELPSHLREDSSVFVQLIKGKILVKSTVIVTSRHSAISGLHYGLDSKRTKHINIKGFNDTSIQRYAIQYFNNKEMMEAFQIYYKGNPMIESMLQVPLTCNIVCLIFNDTYQHDNKPYPKTMTTLYNQYVRMLLKRHLIEAKVIKYNYMMPQHLILEADFKIFELANILQDFFSLSKLAFDGVIKQKYIFGEEFNRVDKLSMMDTIVSFYRRDEVKSSSFLHATLQEYLAAIYLVNNGGPNSTTLKKYLYHSNFENVLTFYVGLLRMINWDVDNSTSDVLQNFTRISTFDKYDSLLFKEKKHVKLHVSTFLQRCIYEHNSLKYHLDMQFEDYTIYLNQNFSGLFDIASDFDFFISGFLVAAYSNTYRVFFYSLQELMSFNKGLLYQSSVVRGSLEIFLNFNASDNLEELLKIPEDVPTILILQSFSVNFQNISKLFLNLQLLLLTVTDCLLCRFNLADHPLLKLNKLNALILGIDPQNFNDSDLEVLKELTAPGRPLRKLHIGPYSVMSYNDKVMALIRQNTSLEELYIRMVHLKHRPADDVRLSSYIWYFPGNKSLYITCERQEFSFIVASLPPIKLAYISLLVSETNSTLIDNIQLNFVHNIIVYSKLMLIEPRLLPSLKATSLELKLRKDIFQLQNMVVASNNFFTTRSSVKTQKIVKMIMNIIHKCYKVSVGNFIYAGISYYIY